MAIVLSFSFFIGLMIVAGNLFSWRKKKHSTEDYLMAGHVHGKLMIALSGAASATSGFVMIGAVGAGYTMGVSSTYAAGLVFRRLHFLDIFSRSHKQKGQGLPL
jgi:Na+/proline symporter